MGRGRACLGLNSALASIFNTDYNGQVASTSTNSGTQHRRWTVIASGLLCCVLALIVMYTKRGAFFSPLAVVVVAAIGLAAVLLQLRFYNREQTNPVHAPVWLNVLGIVFALGALVGDLFRLSPEAAEIMALGAIGSFGISSAIILHAFRKHRIISK